MIRESAARLMAAGVLVALAVGTAAAESAVPLTRVPVKWVETKVGNETIRYERAIPTAEARAIHAYRRRVAGREEAQLEILRVPGRAGIFLISDFGEPRGDYYGRRFVLLRKEKDGFRELAQARPVMDSYILEPVFFTGGGRTIVLAELGSEYSWGLVVYEIAGDDIRKLGDIDATVPGKDGEEDPTPFARVAIEGGRVVVSFEADLVIRTGNSNAPLARKPVVFRQEGAGFKLVPPRR